MKPSWSAIPGPFIHLDELGCLDLLADFGAIWLPPQVWAETQRHRPALSLVNAPWLHVTPVQGNPSPRLQTLAQSLALHEGEFAALTMAEAISATLLLCDDSAARLAAEALGLQVHGTVGIIARSIRRGQRSREAVLDLLVNLPARSSLHIAHGLLVKVIATVRKA